MNTLPATLILLPDKLTDPIRIFRIGEDGATDYASASLSDIRQGEYGIARSEIRRYEITGDADPHLADLVNRRVIVSDQYLNVGSEDGLFQSWVIRAAAINPDRHDVARWFLAARLDPQAPWVAHLAIVIRDALRDHDVQHPVIVGLPDRAYLDASADTRAPAIAPIIPSFGEAIHEIDEHGKRTGVNLPPLSFQATADDDSRAGVVTRASAVIAEALVNSSEADGAAIHDATSLRNRWKAAVDPDHADRLRGNADGTVFSAPVVVLDDHDDSTGRTTLLLATARISIAPDKRDIWLDYHEAISISGNRPFQVDLAQRLRANDGVLDADRAALIETIEDQSLPVLELCTNSDGDFVSKGYARVIADHVPLFGYPLSFSFPQATAALLLFRQPIVPHSTAMERLRSRLWDFVRSGRDALAQLAPQHDAEGIVGEDDQIAHEDDPVGSDAVQREPLHADAGQGEETIDDISDDTGDVSDDGEGEDDQNDTGSGSDETDTDQDDDGDIPDEIVGAGDNSQRPNGEHGGDGPAQQIATAVHNGADGDSEIDPHGTDEDTEVANTDNTVGGTDKIAHVDDGHDSTKDGRSRYYELLSGMTDTDAEYVKRVREAVKSAMRRPTASANLTEVEADDHLRERSASMADILEYVHNHHLASNSKAARETMPLVRQFAEADQFWYRMLYLLNLVQLVRKEGISSPRKMTMRLAG